MTAIYHVPSADFILSVPISVDGGSKQVSRYMRSYYVRAASVEDAGDIVREDGRHEGAVVVEMESPKLRHPSDLPIWLRARLVLNRGRGVCWRSGRAFYPQDDGV
jgi:hypothetical protein